ncbi:alpha/beta hydrolase [Amycolatopsis sp. NPDC051061]|uniref:alpha/beta fold hydrolase n=1 Tax=Amycolatopsis sp. NPDC051061 TaxID=3155042 RepID=UPI003430126F
MVKISPSQHKPRCPVPRGNLTRPSGCGHGRPAGWPSPQCDDAAVRLAASGIPILLLHGRQDMTFPVALLEQTTALIPAARAVVLDDAGHMAHIDQPEQWITAVGEFLE